MRHGVKETGVSQGYSCKTPVFLYHILRDFPRFSEILLDRRIFLLEYIMVSYVSGLRERPLSDKEEALLFMKQFTGYVKKYAAVLFFLAFLIYGRAVVRDYGISWDEATERDSCLVNLGYVIPGAKELVTDTVNYYALPPLQEYKDRYYGVAGQFPAILAEYLNGFRFNFHQIYLLRHMYTFVVFWFACIFFYLMCKNFTHSRFLSLLGVFMLISSPRILAESFYNIKDLLFLSFFVAALYFGLLLIKKQTLPRLLAFGFFGGLCTNVRIVGAILVVNCAVILGWKLLARKNSGSPWWKRLVFTAGSGVLSLLFYMAFTPILWESPIEGLKGVIRTFSSYSSYTQTVFYMGGEVAPDQLPWHYLPVWILATTPVFYLCLMAAGLFFQCGRFFKGCTRAVKEGSFVLFLSAESGMEKVFLILNAFIPLLYVFLRRPVLYNGWRHFYFIYPVMVLAALYGWTHLFGAIKRCLHRGKVAPPENDSDGSAASAWHRYFAHGVGAVLFALGVLPVILWIARNHPFEYLYFNEFARPRAEKYFEKDYWGVSQYDALQYICRNDRRESIKVWTMTPSDNRYLLNYEDQGRIQIVEDLEVADYVIYNHTGVRDTKAIDQGKSLYSSEYVKEVDGMAVYTVFKRVYKPYFSSELESRYTQGMDAAEISSEIGSIDWEVSAVGQGMEFTGTLAEPVYSDRIRLKTNDLEAYAYKPGDLEVYVSRDNVNWVQAEIDSFNGYDYHCVFPAMELSSVRLIHRQGGIRDGHTWNMGIQVLVLRSETNDSYVDTVVRTSTASEQACFCPLAYDRNLDTRWSNAPMPGLSYSVELARPISINEIKLVQAGYRTDFPPALEILYSMDGADWKPLPYQSDDMETFTFETAQMQYIMFRIPEKTEISVSTNWSIYEIQFFMNQHVTFK